MSGPDGGTVTGGAEVPDEDVPELGADGRTTSGRGARTVCGTGKSALDQTLGGGIDEAEVWGQIAFSRLSSNGRCDASTRSLSGGAWLNASNLEGPPFTGTSFTGRSAQVEDPLLRFALADLRTSLNGKAVATAGAAKIRTIGDQHFSFWNPQTLVRPKNNIVHPVRDVDEPVFLILH